jgi:hypothetical protein
MKAGSPAASLNFHVESSLSFEVEPSFFSFESELSLLSFEVEPSFFGSAAPGGCSSAFGGEEPLSVLGVPLSLSSETASRETVRRGIFFYWKIKVGGREEEGCVRGKTVSQGFFFLFFFLESGRSIKVRGSYTTLTSL